MKVNHWVLSSLLAVLLIACTGHAQPMAEDASHTIRSVAPDYTIVYMVQPVETAYSENGKPKLPLDPVFDDKSGYTFTASAHGDKLFFSSTRQKGAETVTLVFDGKCWYSFWSRDNRMKVMPEGLISEAFFIGRMPMLWPGTGWPRIPFIQSTSTTLNGVMAQVSDAHVVSGMKPGLTTKTAALVTRNDAGDTVPTTVKISYKAKEVSVLAESWEFSRYVRFQGLPLASRVVWKTYKDPGNNSNNRFDVPHYTYQARLVTARAAPIGESHFYPLRLIQEIGAGNKATAIDWIQDRSTSTFYYDPSKGDLENNLRRHLGSTEMENISHDVWWRIGIFFVLLLVGAYLWYKRIVYRECI